MNEASIQAALWRKLNAGLMLAMPNYTPVHWWECDFFAVSRSGLATEYEIKISLSDFKADAEKARDVRDPLLGWRMARKESKHDLLCAKSTRGPSRFYYVVPAGLRERVETMLPLWAGLYTATENANGSAHVVEIKKAPRLHGQKVDEKILTHMRSAGYWRFWNQRTNVGKEIARAVKEALRS